MGGDMVIGNNDEKKNNLLNIITNSGWNQKKGRDQPFFLV